MGLGVQTIPLRLGKNTLTRLLETWTGFWLHMVETIKLHGTTSQKGPENPRKPQHCFIAVHSLFSLAIAMEPDCTRGAGLATACIDWLIDDSDAGTKD